MVDEAMIKKLQEEGYSVHKRMNEKCLKRRHKIYWLITKYCDEVQYRYKKIYGERAYIYCFEQYAQDKARNAMKRMYGNLNYHDIPDEQWPEIKEKLFKVAKDYIDFKIQKQMTV